MTKQQKIVTTVVVILIVLLVGFAFVPLVASLVLGPGIKVDSVNAENATEATTELDGEWVIDAGSPPNFTSAGFTFAEVLPAEHTVTSGLTQSVEGSVVIEGDTLTAGEVIVDMDTITTDKDVRDVNTRNNLFESATYPTATFVVTEPVDLAHIPADGRAATVELTGDLTIKNNTHEVTGTFDVLRDGDRLVVGGDLPINREDYGVYTPDMIAAKIDEEGEINVLLSMTKQDS